MNVLTLDVETDIYNRGNPFDDRNKLVCSAAKYNKRSTDCTPWQNNPNAVGYTQSLVDNCDMIVGFNFKFDHHWLTNNGVNLNGKRIWDCQSAHYVLTNQSHIFPSLNDVLSHYGLPLKLDVVKTEYWDRGITTSEISWDVLQPYAVGDVDGTYEVFTRQWAEATSAQRALILMDGEDMHVLREMECNGILYDRELCQQREQETDDKIRAIEVQLAAIYPHVPINFRSNDDLSAFLYGGTIEETIKVHDGFYKSGQKAGQPRLKNQIVSHTLPALYKPVHGSELQKAGYYATNEPTLRSLKGNPKIVNMILDLAKLEKINGTYYKGLPKISEEMNWKDNILHSNFNQTQTKTGRLSSNKPNQQNFASDLLDVFVSRYD